jgi:hypothetical protein
VDAVYVPLFSALAGAVIGSLSSIATILIQTRVSDRRARMQQIAMLALEDFKAGREFVLRPGRTTAAELPPLLVYLQYHKELYDVLERGPLTAARLRELDQSNKVVMDLLRAKRE